MATRAALAAAVASAALLAPLSAAAPHPTPDERFVAELEAAARASRAALRELETPSAARAVESIRRALVALDRARRVAPRAVGALEVPSVRAALDVGGRLTLLASASVARGRPSSARPRLLRAVALYRNALRDFGPPLRREFTATAVHRSFANVSALQGYSGVTATASEEVVEVVIGLATRATATAGGPRASGARGPTLAIEALTAYQIQDPIGAYVSSWGCSFADGLIRCPLRPTLRPRHTFTVAFSPTLEPGTEILVKFEAASGRRSYSVFTAR